MDFQTALWSIVGGFLLSGGLLIYASKRESRISLTGRGRTLSAALFGVGLAAAAVTAGFWFSRLTGIGIPDRAFYIAPFVVAILGWGFKRSRRHWMSTFAEKGGSSYPGDGAQRPSFGVLPCRGTAVQHDDSSADFTAAVEFEHRGHRVLGVQYMPGQSAEPRAVDGVAGTAAVSDSTYNIVQVRTPNVPSIVIRPRSTKVQQDQFGGLEPSEFRPVQDAKLTKNLLGALNIQEPGQLGWESALQNVESGDAEFDKRFEVHTTDPEFAKAVLDPQVRALLTEEPWYWIREAVFHEGSVWAAESGHISEKDLFENSRHVARLATTVPSAAWQHWSGHAFGAGLGTEVTSWAAWHGVEVNSGVASIKDRINLRRRAAQRPPMSALSIVVRSLLIAALFVVAASPVANSALAAVGLAYDVDLKITAVDAGVTSTPHGSAWPEVSGTYERGGDTHEVKHSMWLGSNDPDVGEVVEVEIGPIWWNQMIASPLGSIWMTVAGLLPLLVCYILVKLTFFPKRKVRLLASETPARTGAQPSH